ncbi:hypothetical protein L1887_49921 [Cichorium endivia]|nr:hypothetical protein L1887_49921 [Cichorium endivia]
MPWSKATSLARLRGACLLTRSVVEAARGHEWRCSTICRVLRSGRSLLGEGRSKVVAVRLLEALLAMLHAGSTLCSRQLRCDPSPMIPCMGRDCYGRDAIGWHRGLPPPRCALRDDGMAARTKANQAPRGRWVRACSSDVAFELECLTLCLQKGASAVEARRARRQDATSHARRLQLLCSKVALRAAAWFTASPAPCSVDWISPARQRAVSSASCSVWLQLASRPSFTRACQAQPPGHTRIDPFRASPTRTCRCGKTVDPRCCHPRPSPCALMSAPTRVACCQLRTRLRQAAILAARSSQLVMAQVAARMVPSEVLWLTDTVGTAEAQLLLAWPIESRTTHPSVQGSQF